MPRIPPAALVNSAVIENESAPRKEGKYPPAKEPTIIPNMIIDFRDILSRGTNAYRPL